MGVNTEYENGGDTFVQRVWWQLGVIEDEVVDLVPVVISIECIERILRPAAGCRWNQAAGKFGGRAGAG